MIQGKIVDGMVPTTVPYIKRVLSGRRLATSRTTDEQRNEDA